jgi:DNA adenine methylase
MAELQRMDLRVTTAQKMIELGFEAKLEDENFVFTGEAKKKEEETGQIGGGKAPLQIPERAGRGQPEPDNRQGKKPCPPGKISTPENPKCHPIEWEENKAIQKDQQRYKDHIYEQHGRYGSGTYRGYSINPDISEQGDIEGYYVSKRGRMGTVTPQKFRGRKQALDWINSHLNKDIQKASRFYNNMPQDEYETAKIQRLKEIKRITNPRERLKLIDQSYDDFSINIRATRGQHIGDIISDKSITGILYGLERKAQEEAKKGTRLNEMKGVLKQAFTSTQSSYFNPRFSRTEEEEEELRDVQIRKSGDMLAHYACIGNKLKKAGITPPATRGEKFKNWWDKEKQTNPKAKAINEACDKAGNIGESDPDYPDPPGYNKASDFDVKGYKRKQEVLRKRIDKLKKEADIAEKEGNYVQHKAIWNIIERLEVEYLGLGYKLIEARHQEKSEELEKRMPHKFIGAVNNIAMYLDEYKKLSERGKYKVKEKLWEKYGDSWFNFSSSQHKHFIKSMCTDVLYGYSKEQEKGLKEVYACQKCGKQFPLKFDRKKLIAHGRTHDPNYPESGALMFSKVLTQPFSDLLGKADKAVESGQAVDQETQKIENHFIKTLEKTLLGDLIAKIKELASKSVVTRAVLIKLIYDLILKSTSKMEKQAFAEILRAYKEGKDMVSPEGKLEKMSPIIGTTMGKTRSAKALVSVIPKHETYNEPFMGGANTFLQKQPASNNYLNDFDEELVKVYKIVQLGSEKIFKYLIKRKWKPSPSLFKKLQKQTPEKLSDAARAYRKLYLRRHSFNTAETHFSKRERPSGNYAPKWLKTFEKFKEYADLFQKAEFTAGDWREPTFKADSPTTYHFFDPPYNTPKVIKEWSDKMCSELPKLKGKWMLTFAHDKPTMKCFKSKGFEVNVVKYANLAAAGSNKELRKEIIVTNYKINVPKGTVFKSRNDLMKAATEDDKAPRFALRQMQDFTKDDTQVLRAIYEENPFWESFAAMSKAASERLKDLVTESYEPVNSSRMKATVRDVKAQYLKKKKPIRLTQEEAENIAYGRIGKFNLAKTVEAMKTILKTEVYRLERIARTETTGVTAKGREIAMKERDVKNEYKYDWFGPVDHRTSDICKAIGKQVQQAGAGAGVPLVELKDIMKEVVDDLNPKWGYRDWVPHANCRRVLRRVS